MKRTDDKVSIPHDTNAVTRALQDKEQWYQKLFYESGVGVVINDKDGRILDVNPAVCRFLGYTAQELAGMSVSDITFPEDREKTAAAIKEMMNGGAGVKRLTKRYLHKNGEVKWGEVNASTVRDGMGNVAYLMGQITDITKRQLADQVMQETLAERDSLLSTAERSRLALLSILEDEKETKQELRNSEEKWRRLVSTSPDFIALHDLEGRYLYLNHYAEGFRESDVIGKSLYDFITDDSREKYKKAFEACVETRTTQYFDYTAYGDNRTIRYYETYLVPVIKQDRIESVMTIAKDITQRKLAEQELKEREARLQKIFEILPVGLWFADKEGKLTRGNPAGVKIWGAEPHVPMEKYGVFKARRLPGGEEIKADDWALARTIKEGVTVTDELLEIDAFDGRKKIILNYTAPVLDDEGKVQGAIVVNNDITQLKKTETLQQALYQISDAAIGCKDLQQLYIQLHKTIARLMPAENLYIALYDVKSDSISFPYYRDQKNDYNAPRRFGKGLTEHIIKTGKPLLVNKQVHDLLQREGRAEFVGQPSKQWLGVPLQSENKTFGALVIQSYEEKAEYTQRDLELLNFVAGNVAVAIRSIQADQELADSETRYRTFMDSATDIAFLKDDQLCFLMVNKAQEEFFGKPADQILGKTDYELMPPEAAQACRLSDQMVLESKQTMLSHEQVGKRVYEARKFPVELQNGRTGVGAYIRDITEQQRADQAIRESQEKYRDLVENINDVVFAVDIYGKLIYISPSSEPVLGYRPDEIIGRKLIEFVKEDDRTLLARELQKSIEKGVAASEYRITTKNGVTKWISSSSRLIMEDGKPVGLNGLMTDITERKQAEKDIIFSETRYRRLFETAQECILILNAETGYIEDANPYIKDMLGYPREELIGKQLWEIGLFKDIVASKDSFIEMKKKGRVRYEGLPLQTKAGQKKDVEFVSNLYPVGDHNVVQCNIRDVTQRVQAETQIKLAAKKWETTFDSIGDGVCLLDRQWKVLQCNQAFTKMVNKPYAEILGRTCYELVHGLKQPSEDCPVARMEKTLRREALELERGGRHLRITVDPILDQHNNLIGAVHIIADISNRKQLEQELLQAQKMEAVGFLAGGVAHDFNNMLAGIVGNAELLQLKIYGQKELETYLDNILKAAGHAAGLTKQLLAFARKGQYQQVPVNVHKVIAETLGILGNTIDRKIKIEQHLRANPSVVLGDHSQLENALMNLGINARDAMPDGGKLIFSTDLINLDKEYIFQHNYKIEPGHYIQISVDDTGSGMSDEVRRHLFEPFFTTKEKGRGTGLGLAGVYGCVKNHGGSVEVYSEPGRGTSIKLYLPLYGELTATGEQDLVSLKVMSVTAGTGSILIVDDEDMIRTIAAQILKTAGYQVQTCADGQEAVELYSKDHSRIDLVIMDMVMPRVDGRQAYARMREINPGVKMLLSSGFSEDGDAQAILQEGALGFIQKPYRSAELLLRVQQALQTKNSG